MCGIVGYTGPREAGPILIEGLKRLEYRGYDSAGIALVDDAGDLFVEKRAGKLVNLQTAIADRTPARRDRSRAHALGDPRPAERPERPSAPGLHRRDHGHPQRDHRELPRAARRAGGARPHADLRRPTPRRSPTSSRRPTRATWPTPCATPSAGSRAPTPSSSCTAARATGWSARARTSRSSSASPTARASWPRTSRRSSPTPTRSSSSRTATSPTSARGASRSPTSTARSSSDRSPPSTGRPRPPRRAATSTSCSRRSTSSPRPSASRSPDGSTGTDRIHVEELAGLEEMLRSITRVELIACGSAYYASLIARQRHPGLDRAPGAGHRRLRVPLRPAAARRATRW